MYKTLTPFNMLFCSIFLFMFFGNVKAQDANSESQVDFISLDGKKTGQNIQLYWEVENQVGISAFEIQHSMDSRNFETLEIFEGDGTFEPSRSFYFLHRYAHEGTNYYRVKAIGLDDFSLMGNILPMKIAKEDVLDIVPNPASSELRVFYREHLGSIDEVVILNTIGRPISYPRFEDRGSHVWVNVDNLDNGMYFIRLHDNTGECIYITRKFLKSGGY